MDEIVSAADVADGWVDALCQCGNSGSHRGALCPQRPDAAGTLTAEQQAAYDAAKAQDIADTRAALAAAQEALDAMGASPEI